MVIPMEKQIFLDRLRETGTSQAQMCRDLIIATTTAMRWTVVPGYAVAYLLALEAMEARQRLEYRHALHLARLDRGVK